MQRGTPVNGSLAIKLALLWQIFSITDSRISFSMIYGWSAFGGPTMRSTLSGWEVELAQWLKPFLDRLGHKARRRMCPLYVTGLIGPGDRKSVQPMAERLAPGDYDQRADARTAENGSARKCSLNKSAKVVLGRVLINRLDVRFASKATEMRYCREMTRRASSRHRSTD